MHHHSWHGLCWFNRPPFRSPCFSQPSNFFSRPPVSHPLTLLPHLHPCRVVAIAPGPASYRETINKTKYIRNNRKGKRKWSGKRQPTFSPTFSPTFTFPLEEQQSTERMNTKKKNQLTHLIPPNVQSVSHSIAYSLAKNLWNNIDSGIHFMFLHRFLV